jgi:hypothetical protein
VTMKNAVFWDVAARRSCVNRHFGGTYLLHLQSLQPRAHSGSSLADFSTLKMEAICSSETSVQTRSTWRHILEDGILLSQGVSVCSFYFHCVHYYCDDNHEISDWGTQYFQRPNEYRSIVLIILLTVYNRTVCIW